MSDDLYPRAVALVLQDQKPSAAYLQRKLQLTNNSACALLERMQAEGIVSAANHIGKREILKGPSVKPAPQPDHIAEVGNRIEPTPAPAKPAYTGPVSQFTCSSCDTMQCGPQNGLPEGWYPQIIERIGTVLRCPSCAERHATRIATSTMTTEQIMSAGQDGEETDAVTTAAQGRLSRDMGDLADIHKRLTFCGVEIATLNEGVASTITIGLRGIIGQLYREDLAQKTRRGMRGKVSEGLSAGGRSYRYDLHPRNKGELLINDTEADTVRPIFTDYAGGKSPQTIAADLNREGIKAPRGKFWHTSTIYGWQERGTGILRKPAL